MSRRLLWSVWLATTLAACAHTTPAAGTKPPTDPAQAEATDWAVVTRRVWASWTRAAIVRALGEEAETRVGNGLHTSVWVELKHDGSLARVRVFASSGITSFDDLAVATVERAGPFPRPASKTDPREVTRHHMTLGFGSLGPSVASGGMGPVGAGSAAVP